MLAGVPNSDRTGGLDDFDFDDGVSWVPNHSNAGNYTNENSLTYDVFMPPRTRRR